MCLLAGAAQREQQQHRQCAFLNEHAVQHECAEYGAYIYMYIRLCSVLCTLCEHTANQPTRTHTDERTTLRRRWCGHQPAGQSWKEGGGNGFWMVWCAVLLYLSCCRCRRNRERAACVMLCRWWSIAIRKTAECTFERIPPIEKIKYKQRTWLIVGENGETTYKLEIQSKRERAKTFRVSEKQRRTSDRRQLHEHA